MYAIMCMNLNKIIELALDYAQFVIFYFCLLMHFHTGF